MPALRISEHPVFDRCRPQVEQMIAEVRMLSSQYESQLVKSTAKGQMMN